MGKMMLYVFWIVATFGMFVMKSEVGFADFCIVEVLFAGVTAHIELLSKIFDEIKDGFTIEEIEEDENLTQMMEENTDDK